MLKKAVSRLAPGQQPGLEHYRGEGGGSDQKWTVGEASAASGTCDVHTALPGKHVLKYDST